MCEIGTLKLPVCAVQVSIWYAEVNIEQKDWV